MNKYEIIVERHGFETRVYRRRASKIRVALGRLLELPQTSKTRSVHIEVRDHGRWKPCTECNGRGWVRGEFVPIGESSTGKPIGNWSHVKCPTCNGDKAVGGDEVYLI